MFDFASGDESAGMDRKYIIGFHEDSLAPIASITPVIPTVLTLTFVVAASLGVLTLFGLSTSIAAGISESSTFLCTLYVSRSHLPPNSHNTNYGIWLLTIASQPF